MSTKSLFESSTLPEKKACRTMRAGVNERAKAAWQSNQPARRHHHRVRKSKEQTDCDAKAVNPRTERAGGRKNGGHRVFPKRNGSKK